MPAYEDGNGSAEVLDRNGRVDVLVNNAGRGAVGAAEETTDGELRDLMDLHFFGPAALTRGLACASPWLRRPASRGGRRLPAPARKLTRSGNPNEQRHSGSAARVKRRAPPGAQLRRPCARAGLTLFPAHGYSLLALERYERK